MGSVPHFQAEVEDGQRDWWQKDGGPPLAEVKRNGPVQLPASAATRLRHFQELRGPLPCRLHGWQWCGDARKGDLLRAQGGCRCRWQEEVSQPEGSFRSRYAGGMSCLQPETL